jgi:hypothetical protein
MLFAWSNRSIWNGTTRPDNGTEGWDSSGYHYSSDMIAGFVFIITSKWYRHWRLRDISSCH